MFIRKVALIGTGEFFKNMITLVTYQFRHHRALIKKRKKIGTGELSVTWQPLYACTEWQQWRNDCIPLRRALVMSMQFVEPRLLKVIKTKKIEKTILQNINICRPFVGDHKKGKQIAWKRSETSNSRLFLKQGPIKSDTLQKRLSDKSLDLLSTVRFSFLTNSLLIG